MIMQLFIWIGKCIFNLQNLSVMYMQEASN